MRFATVTILLSVLAPGLRGQSVAGTWQGYWTRAGDTMPVTLQIRRDSAGGYSATFDSDRLRVSGIPFSRVGVQREGGGITMILQGDRTTATFGGVLRGDSIKGSFVEDNSPEGSFAYARSRRVGAAFDEREITFSNGEVRLSGSLLIPGGKSRVPGVVFVHGSGAEGRWASRYLATQLVTHGIAALIWDKRGVGQSTGNWRTATPDDLAADATAALARLRGEPRIDSTRIGIHGHSQGGTLAPMIAVKAGAAFVIASAGAGTPLDSVEIFSVLNSVYPEARTARDSADARAYVGELVSVAYHGAPRTRLDSLVTALQARAWYFAPPAPDNSYWTFSRQYAEYDPLAWWARVRVPALLIYGENDQRVPARESAERIRATLQRNAPGVDLTVKILPGADHTFRLAPGPGGWPRTARDYVPTLLQWLGER